MIDLPLTKLSETTRVITLGWTPIPCIGYVFYVNGKRVSNTWNPAVNKTTFAKVPNGVYAVEAIEVKAKGVYPPVVTPNLEAYSEDPYGSAVYSR